MIRNLYSLPGLPARYASSSCAAAGLSRLQGKIAVVTASTDGIGYAIAERLASEGASVVVSSRKEANVTKAVADLRSQGFTVEGVVCHVANAEHRQKLFEVANKKFGGVDILVSNAAVNIGVGRVLDIDDKTWDKTFEVNVKNAWQLAKEAYPAMQKRGGGSIVFTSSILAYHPIEPFGVYSISKTSLLGLTRAIANELARDNIRVNCIAPGVVATKFASAVTESESSRKIALANVPMKRFGKTNEIAAAAAFLVSEDAAYMTGETLIVAGGQTVHL